MVMTEFGGSDEKEEEVVGEVLLVTRVHVRFMRRDDVVSAIRDSCGFIATTRPLLRDKAHFGPNFCILWLAEFSF